MSEGITLWFTGLPAAGKSTVAGAVARRLQQRGARVEVLDGDVVRRELCADLGFSPEDRDENVRRLAFVADLLSRNGVSVCVAAISPYRAAREAARTRIGDRFVEIYVKASAEACATRDPKGLYEQARRGELPNFTGVSDPYEEPLAPEITLETELHSPEQSVATVLRWLEERSASERGYGAGTGTWGSPKPKVL